MQKQVIKIFFLLTTFLMLPGFAFAAPSITGVSGTVSDGNSVTISGGSFGTNSAVGTSALEFLGGANGPIESGTVGSTFSRSGWDADWASNDGVSSAPKIIANDSVHSGTKSLKTTVVPATLWDGTMSYQLPTASNTVFISYWVKHDTGVTDGQWKMFRVATDKTIVDCSTGGVPSVLFSNWYSYETYTGDTCGGSSSSPNTASCIGSGCDVPVFSPSMAWFGDEYYPAADNNWYRMDIWLNNTSYTATRWFPGSTKYSETTSPWTSRNWTYLIWQDYIGNNSSGTTTNIWQDDFFVQEGTQARVELCDASTWANSTHCEIQYPTSWNDSATTITLNKGSFTNGTGVYLYVIDSTGTANASGYAVTLGSGTSDTTPPAAPSGLSVM